MRPNGKEVFAYRPVRKAGAESEKKTVNARTPASSQRCASCGAFLSSDEIGATRKMINRGAQTYYCLNCLAARFGVTPQDISAAIERWRNMGCALFAV